MRKKITDIIFVTGVCLIIVGLLSGVVVGFVTGNKEFNFVPAIVVWLIAIIAGTGFVSISGSLNEVNQKNEDDEEMLKMIIEKIKNEK